MSLTKVSYSMISGAFYNVIDYGATGNGSTDDTTAIQSVLDAAFTAGGGTVYLPVGTYKISKPLIVRSNTILEGAGADSQVKQTSNYNGAGNLIHIGYGYEWNQNGQSFNPSSNDDATMAQLLANNFSKLTTINAGVRNLYIEGYVNGNRPGLGVWFMNAFECFCDHIWAKNTLVPVTVGNDAIGWQAGCANISVSDIWQVSCNTTTDSTPAGSFSWFDLMFIGSSVYTVATRLYCNPATPAALNNKIQTAGACYFTISDSIFYGKYLDADVGIGVNSNNVTAVVGANITGCTFVRCTTGVGLYENNGNSLTNCSVSGSIFKQCYIGIDTVGSTNGNHNISANLYIGSGLKDVNLGSYTNYTNSIYEYGSWYLNGSTNVTSAAKAVMRWNSANGFNGMAMVDEDTTAVGRRSVEFIRGTTGTVVGGIDTTLSTTAYTTSSDYRLKENPQPLTNALNKVSFLKPVNFVWKNTGESGQSFIAHELQEFFPEAVRGEKDATIDIGKIADQDGKILHTEVSEPKNLPEGLVWTKTGVKPVYQGIDTSFLIPVLTAAIQELKAEFDAYKTAHP